MRSTHGGLALFAAVLALGLGSARAGDAPPVQDLSTLDLSGEWYVLVHYKDERSENKEITKFKDFAWSIQHSEQKLTWESFPYVLFDEDLELVRRNAMSEHLPWEPDQSLWAKIRESIGVSSRAASKKTLRGSRDQGFASLPPMAGGAMNTLSFSRSWNVTFAPEAVRIQITDSLSGSPGLEGMEDTTSYEITERVAPDELRGTYAESTKHGRFRMVRSQQRRVVK